jgi:hypothetical protein
MLHRAGLTKAGAGTGLSPKISGSACWAPLASLAPKEQFTRPCRAQRASLHATLLLPGPFVVEFIG